MKECIVRDIENGIAKLRKHNESISNLAQRQLELLDKTNASLQDYIDFRGDIDGAVAVYNS